MPAQCPSAKFQGEMASLRRVYQAIYVVTKTAFFCPAFVTIGFYPHYGRRKGID